MSSCISSRRSISKHGYLYNLLLVAQMDVLQTGREICKRKTIHTTVTDHKDIKIGTGSQIKHQYLVEACDV